LEKVDGMASFYKRLCRYAARVNQQLDVFMQHPDHEKTLHNNSTRFFFVRVKTSFQALQNIYRRKRIEIIGRGVESQLFKPRESAGPKLTALLGSACASLTAKKI
jgi:hypothetical protein